MKWPKIKLPEKEDRLVILVSAFMFIISVLMGVNIVITTIKKNTPGIQGTQGVQGKPGLPGAKGDKGEKGEVNMDKLEKLQKMIDKIEMENDLNMTVTDLEHLKTRFNELKKDFTRAIYGDTSIDAVGLEKVVFDEYPNRFSKIEKKIKEVENLIKNSITGTKTRIMSLEKNQDNIYKDILDIRKDIENNKRLANYAADKADKIEGKIKK